MKSNYYLQAKKTCVNGPVNLSYLEISAQTAIELEKIPRILLPIRTSQGDITFSIVRKEGLKGKIVIHDFGKGDTKETLILFACFIYIKLLIIILYSSNSY